MIGFHGTDWYKLAGILGVGLMAEHESHEAKNNGVYFFQTNGLDDREDMEIQLEYAREYCTGSNLFMDGKIYYVVI